MCQYFSKKELKDCCEDPNFCVVCLNTGRNVKDHCCEDCREESVPGMLPIVTYKGKKYYIDCRLREFRPVEPPLKSIPFDSELGQRIDSSWHD